MYLQFSKNKFSMLKLFQKRGEISDNDALFLNQITLNALAYGGFIFKTKTGFSMSHAGIDILQNFGNADVIKDHPSKEFGKKVQVLKTIRNVREIRQIAS